MTATCKKCGTEVNFGDWPICPHGPLHPKDASIHHKERAVKYYHPDHGWRTPGRSDRPMPAHLQELGFQRVEFDGIRQLESHSAETGARSEVLDYDKGSGRAEKQYSG